MLLFLLLVVVVLAVVVVAAAVVAVVVVVVLNHCQLSYETIVPLVYIFFSLFGSMSLYLSVCVTLSAC